MPSYSRKYNAVPAVSRKKWSRNPVYNPAKPLPLYISFTACSVPGGFTKEMPLVAAIAYSNCRRTFTSSNGALPNDIRAPDIAPLIPPVSEVSMILSRHRMLLFRKFSLVPEYMVKLAAQKIWSSKVSTTLDRIPLCLPRDKQVRQA